MKTKLICTYIKSDLYRYSKRVDIKSFLYYYFLNYSFKYTFWLRMSKHHSSIVRFYSKARLLMLRRKTGIDIHFRTQIGFGLYVAHAQSVVVSEYTIIGNNCNLAQFTTIGSNHRKAARIGDNVYIGPNVCLVEDVVIGDNVTIGAGAVVTKDIPENATVAGVPAKILHYDNPARYIGNRFIID